jgi:integrase
VLTDIQIKKLMPSEKRREIPDGRISGLYLLLQPSGARSWAVRYRVGGKPAKFTLGSYPAVDLATARKRAQEALGELAGGNDPHARRKAAREARKAEQSIKDRVEDVAAVFVERYVKKNVGDAWARETERLLRVEIIPKLGGKRLGEVKRSDVHDLLDGIVDRGSPITANRTLAVFRKLCNWAIERGIIAASPADKIKAPAAEESRDRVLGDDEIRIAWRAFERVGWPYGPISELLLLTGARLNEIAAARWSEIDLDAKTWTIAKERVKNGVAHEIPLSDAAIKVLSALPRMSARPDALVFSRTGRTPVSSFFHAKASIDAAIVETLEEGEKAPAHWTFHDLRRTAASGMAGLGFAPHVVEAVLNHRSGTIKGVAAVYNKYNYASEKRAALDAWARRLKEIVSGAESNVVPLIKGRA